jgi:hypothetical protein
MNRLYHAKIVLILMGVLSVPLQASAQVNAGRLATPQELRQFHDAGQYLFCVQQIARVLRADSAGKHYDRYDLLLLRGDCLLHLEDPGSALLAYSAASASPVAKQARQARAMAFLLRGSTGMTYQTRGDHDHQEKFNLASEQDRTKALRALLKDEQRANQSNFDRAEHADNLVPVQEVLPTLADLYAVERTVTGDDLQMRPILEAIAERAIALIDRELEIREETVASLDRRAAALVDGWRGGGYARRGLNTYERRDLRELIEYLQRIEETTRRGRDLAGYFDGDAKTWEPLITRAAKVVSRAQDVLDAE